jgi:ribonuclease HII
VVSIAAASIVAKVSRDRLMCRLALDHPGYGFEQHMGYGVPAHLEALDRLGPTIHHRRFFAPVAAAREKHEGRIGGEIVSAGIETFAAAGEAAE